MRGFSFRLRPGFLCAELVAFGGVFLCPEVFFSVRSKDSVNIGICVSFFCFPLLSRACFVRRSCMSVFFRCLYNCLRRALFLAFWRCGICFLYMFAY